MVPRWRFELQTLWLKVKCSTDWANEAYNLVAPARFELTNATVKVWCLTAWLRGNNQTKKVVEGHGFEPWNPKEQIYSLPRLTTSLSLHMVPKTGIEPVTYWLQVSCSTNWAISAMVGDIGLEPMTPCL